MYALSQSVIDLFQKHYRQVLRITFTKGDTTFQIDESEIIQGGCTIDRYSVSGQKVELGSAIAAELTLKLKNYDGKYDDTVFEGGELFVEVGVKKWDAHRWENAIIHYVPCGHFIIDTPPRAKTTINISALDRMVLFDKVADLSLITFPIRLDALITRVCEICGVTCATTLGSLVNYNYVVQAAPTTQGLTYRTLIQWCAFLSATCAYMDYDGKLVFQWYTQTNFPISGAERYSSDMYENDITVTGIVYTGSDGSVYTTGDTDYTITYNGCDILQTGIEFALANIYYAIRNFSYRPYEAVIKPAPFLYPMDMIKYKDNKGVVHDTIVTNVTFTVNNNTTISGSGETLTQNDYASASGLTAEQQQAISDMKNSIEVIISDEVLVSLNGAQVIANAMGYNMSIVTSGEDQEIYIHNAATIAASNNIYTIRNGHIAYTDNWNGGQPTWVTTITSANNIIVKVLTEYKVTGAQIASGAITSDHLAAALKAAITLEIETAAAGALNSAKSYTDSGVASAKSYSDGNLNTAKAYSDSNLNTAKAYSDGNLVTAKGYTDTKDAAQKTYIDGQIDTTQGMAKKLYITGSDGVEYAGKLKCVNGKPVFEY